MTDTPKKILFVTGTRADFGKLKPLMVALENHPGFDPHIFVTGMHMHEKYGFTLREVEKTGFKKIFPFINYTSEASMDLTLAKTIEGISSFVRENRPDLIVVHGDRVEPLAGAVVGALNNILVAHIEGGEVSGTVDELLRHAVSKMSHIHFASNEEAKRRLMQLGEDPDAIWVIGSPDIDIMFSEDLPTIEDAKGHYDLEFDRYAIAAFHPVTTEIENLAQDAEQFVEALIKSGDNYIVIYPNNDLGSELILNAYTRLEGNERFRVIPSIRFEYFLTLLKNAEYIIGNSSAGVREAPYYGVPTINIGSRQTKRAEGPSIFNCSSETESVMSMISSVKSAASFPPIGGFGNGNSTPLFVEALREDALWRRPKQKMFKDLFVRESL